MKFAFCLLAAGAAAIGIESDPLEIVDDEAWSCYEPWFYDDCSEMWLQFIGCFVFADFSVTIFVQIADHLLDGKLSGFRN